MMMLSLVNIISKTTRITDNSNTLLDPIIISDTVIDGRVVCCPFKYM